MDLHGHEAPIKPRSRRSGDENKYALPTHAKEFGNPAAASKAVPTTCRRCGLPLPKDQIEANIRARKADLYNTRTALVLFLILLAGLAMVFFSIGELRFTSALFSQAMFYLFLVGVFLSAYPFLILAMKGTRLFKNIEGTSYYCPSCLKTIKDDQGTVSGDRDLPTILASGRSKHYENDVKPDRKGLVFLMIGILVPGLIFGWLYGAYVKGFDFQANLEATLFSMALVAGILLFVSSRFVTPRSVDIEPNGVIVESKRGRRKTIHFDKITWLNIVMDVQQLKDYQNATGTIDVGRGGIFQMNYRIKREIALEIREAYRACRGVYPPNGLDVKPDVKRGR